MFHRGEYVTHPTNHDDEDDDNDEDEDDDDDYDYDIQRAPIVNQYQNRKYPNNIKN